MSALSIFFSFFLLVAKLSRFTVPFLKVVSGCLSLFKKALRNSEKSVNQQEERFCTSSLRKICLNSKGIDADQLRTYKFNIILKGQITKI
jgi:hypothetical protein